MPVTREKLPVLSLSFTQIFLEPGSVYQFSHHFLRVLDLRLAGTVCASQAMFNQFPGLRDICFLITAAKRVPKRNVWLERHFPRRHQTEFWVVLPFSWTRRSKLERHQRVVSCLVNTVATLFEEYGVDTTELRSHETGLLAELASNTEKYFDDFLLG
jgi:hypothetical protein